MCWIIDLYPLHTENWHTAWGQPLHHHRLMIKGRLWAKTPNGCFSLWRTKLAVGINLNMFICSYVNPQTGSDSGWLFPDSGCLVPDSGLPFEDSWSPLCLYITPIGSTINYCLAIVQSLRLLAGIEIVSRKLVPVLDTEDWMRINIRPEKALKPGSCQSNVKQLDTRDWWGISNENCAVAWCKLDWTLFAERYVKINEKKYKSNVPTKNSLMCITQLEYIWSVPWKRHILSNAGKCNNLKHLIYCKATCEILFFSHPISRTLTVVPFRKLLFLGGFTVCIRNIWWELPENMF